MVLDLFENNENIINNLLINTSGDIYNDLNTLLENNSKIKTYVMAKNSKIGKRKINKMLLKNSKKIIRCPPSEKVPKIKQELNISKSILFEKSKSDSKIFLEI